MTLATTTNSFTGATTVVANGATITRPAGEGEIVVMMDLWANGTGHFTTAADGDARLGHPAFGMTTARATRSSDRRHLFSDKERLRPD